MRAALERFGKAAAADERGATTLVFALSLFLLMFCTGMAVDMARWMHARRVTAAAVDAGVLAGTRALQTAPDSPTAAVQMARNVYQTNVASRVKLQSDTISFSVSNDNKSMSAGGSASLATTLLASVGLRQLEVANFAGADQAVGTIASGGSGGSHLEIAVMLDVTGSMCDNGEGPCTTGTKLSGLKLAAKDLINIVVADDQSRYTSRVALVPFSTRVRVGPDGGGGAMMTALTGMPSTWSGWQWECTQSNGGGGGSEGDGDWACPPDNWEPQYASNLKIMPCVTDRFYNTGWRFEATDAAPGPNFWLNGHDGNRKPVGLDSSNAAVPNNPDDGRGTDSGHAAWHWNYDYWGGCADVAQANEILPLTSNKADLRQRIEDLEAYGSTAGALGTAWAWYMLSPNWASIFQGTSTPGAYADLANIQANGAPLRRKVAVLMTDGGYNTYRSSKGQNQQTVSDYALELCTNMKAQGIEVYTVGFALNELTATERTIATNTLRACGTDVRHFYETLTVPQLQAAFRDIATQLSALVLTR